MLLTCAASTQTKRKPNGKWMKLFCERKKKWWKKLAAVKIMIIYDATKDIPHLKQLTKFTSRIIYDFFSSAYLYLVASCFFSHFSFFSFGTRRVASAFFSSFSNEKKAKTKRKKQSACAHVYFIRTKEWNFFPFLHTFHNLIFGFCFFLSFCSWQQKKQG